MSNIKYSVNEYIDFPPGLCALPGLECGRRNPQPDIPQCGRQQENHHCIKPGKHTCDQNEDGIDYEKSHNYD